jgi:integrase/recombinase XerD
MKTIEIDIADIDGQKRIRLFFPFDKEIIELIKTIPGARWHPKMGCWHISTIYGPAYKLDYRFQYQIRFVPYNDKTFSQEEEKIKAHKSPSLQKPTAKNNLMEEFVKTLKIRNYSPKTVKTYTSQFRLFMQYYNGSNINDLSGKEIREYLLYLLEKKKASFSHENQAINAIKFYYEKILGKEPETYYIQRPKSEKKLPVVLSEEEVTEILKNICNLKHRCILYTIYSGGLRLSEVLNLKPKDIDSKRRMIVIRHGKGAKDRVTLLSERLIPMLREYYRKYKPKVWLFEGKDHARYSARSVQEILKAAVRNTRIRKKVTVHTLRHSFATHLLEHGIDLTYIQEFLGHSNIKTTLIYTHITTKGIDKIKSPLDNLEI